MHKVKIIKQVFADVLSIYMGKNDWIIRLETLNPFNLQNMLSHIKERNDAKQDFR